jgi:hypothetical protein
MAGQGIRIACAGTADDKRVDSMVVSQLIDDALVINQLHHLRRREPDIRQLFPVGLAVTILVTAFDDQEVPGVYGPAGCPRIELQVTTVGVFEVPHGHNPATLIASFTGRSGRYFDAFFCRTSTSRLMAWCRRNGAIAIKIPPP